MQRAKSIVAPLGNLEKLENINVMDPTKMMVSPKQSRSIVGQAGEM